MQCTEFRETTEASACIENLKSEAAECCYKYDESSQCTEFRETTEASACI
ncbi:MAG: hypothetical protein RR716_00670 [Christensenellaceae bacterium]